MSDFIRKSIGRAVTAIQRLFVTEPVRAKDSKLNDAARAGDKDLCAQLISEGYGVNHVAGDNNNTPLHEAALSGGYDVCEYLLNKGAALEIKDMIGFTALVAASQQGHTEVVRLLLRRGANTAATTRWGAAAIHMAAQFNREPVVRILVTEGRVDPNQVRLLNKYI